MTSFATSKAMRNDSFRAKAFSDSQLSMTTSGNWSVQHSRLPSAMHLSDELTNRLTKYGSLYSSAPPRGSTHSSGGGKACCVAGEHLINSGSQEFIRRSLSLNSLVYVDICDITGDGDAPMVPLSLRRCKKMILAPYTVLLSVIGWRPWNKDGVSRFPCLWRMLNAVYPILVVFLMLYNFVFQVLVCQGKFNIHKDIMPLPTKPPTTAPTIGSWSREAMEILPSNCTLPKLLMGECGDFPPKEDDTTKEEPSQVYCQHILPTYVVPGILHFLAYTYGFYHFRLQESEQLHSLMERVFLQAHATPGVQSMLIRNSRLYLVGALVWLLLQCAVELLYNFTYKIKIRCFGEIISMSTGLYYTLLSLKFLGLGLVQCVNVAVVINYCMQCEMLVFHIKGVYLRLHEKTIEIKDAMHEILGVRAFISLMNETMGKMVAYCVVNFTELTIVGSAMLILNRNFDSKVLAYRIMLPALWCTSLIIPLLQASRLTRVGAKLRQVSFEMRVFGYQTASQMDLDSFVLFVSGATLRTKLFGVTIRPALIILTFGAAVFIILTLMVVDLISISGYKYI